MLPESQRSYGLHGPHHRQTVIGPQVPPKFLGECGGPLVQELHCVRLCRPPGTDDEGFIDRFVRMACRRLDPLRRELVGGSKPLEFALCEVQ